MRLIQGAVAVGAIVSACVVVSAQQPAPQPQTPPPPATAGQKPATNLGSDANGNPLRLALKTGHVSNYDDSKLAPYTLPDPLVAADGNPVKDATAWRKRREEILRLYENEIYGRIPANAPGVTWQVTETDPAREGGRGQGLEDSPHARLPGPQARLCPRTPASRCEP